MTHALSPLCRAFAGTSVRYVLIDVSGANLYAPSGQAIFTTEDFDFYLPLEPDNLVRAWAACESVGFELWFGEEPLDRPRDRWLADRIIANRALTRATAMPDVYVDLTLVMKGYDFETVWRERRDFTIDGIPMSVARLLDIVRSKEAAGRDKDRLFLATHEEALRQLLDRQDD